MRKNDDARERITNSCRRILAPKKERNQAARWPPLRGGAEQQFYYHQDAPSNECLSASNGSSPVVWPMSRIRLESF